MNRVLLPLAKGLETDLTFASPGARHLVSALPGGRGAWLVGTLLMQALPPAFRRANLSLRTGEVCVDVELDLTDHVQLAMAKHGSFDVATAAVIWNLLNAGETFVDVGANWGYFTCIASRRIGPSGLVVALEPSPIAHRRLLDTIRRNLLVNVVCVNVAASDTVGTGVSLFRPFYRQTTSTYVRALRAGSSPDTITTTVDYLLSKLRAAPVGMVKVDTEGAELPVVRGARELLGDIKPWIILEVSASSRRFGYATPDLYQYMLGLGYARAFFIRDDPRCPGVSGPIEGPVEGQILFQHRDSRVELGVPPPPR